jgi:RNA polymerase sigma-70 factor (ECF subfamily)
MPQFYSIKKQDAPSETSIVEALTARDESALGDVSRLYGRMLHGIALRITGNEADAEECVNDALLDLWNAVPPGRPSRLSAFVSSLVRRRAIDRVRYNAARQRTGSTFVESTDELAECLADPDGYSNCYTLAIRDSLQAFVDRLPEEDRRIFLLRYYRFESHETIAELCGLSVPAVAMRLMRLRKRLKKALNAEGIPI